MGTTGKGKFTSYMRVCTRCKEVVRLSSKKAKICEDCKLPSHWQRKKDETKTA